MSLRRTVVIGTSCSGKTTFAKQLAKLLGVQHVELDAINWLPNWVERPKDEFRALVETAVSADQWVVDGNYSKARDVVWPRATAFIWLNYSFPVVMARALKRTTNRVFGREVLYSGNHETFRKSYLSRDSILVWILKSYRRRRSEYPKLLHQLNHLEIRTFNAPEEADKFLALLESENRGKSPEAVSVTDPVT